MYATVRCIYVAVEADSLFRVEELRAPVVRNGTRQAVALIVCEAAWLSYGVTQESRGSYS